MSPPKVSGPLGSGDDGPVADRLVDGVTGDPAERLVRQRKHRPIRRELAHRVSQFRLQLLDAGLVALDH
jgi:hypothetical protein